MYVCMYVYIVGAILGFLIKFDLFILYFKHYDLSIWRNFVEFLDYPVMWICVAPPPLRITMALKCRS